MFLHNIIRRLVYSLLFVIEFILQPKLLAISKYSTIISLPTPFVISYVTVSENSNNCIVWNKQQNENIEHYCIYRNSTNFENNWNLVSIIDSNIDTVYNDVNTFSNIQAYKYKISAKDRCGNEYFSNQFFKTICLTLKKLPDSASISLNWNAYEGMNVLLYEIFRGLSINNMEFVDNVSSDKTTYSDQIVSQTNYYYRVVAIGYNSDTIYKKNFIRILKKNPDTLYIKSFSNFVNTVHDNVLLPYNNKYIQIIPNPLKIESIVRFLYDSSKKYYLKIFDILGSLVYNQELSSGEFLLDKQKFNSGIYIIQINDGEISYEDKLIVDIN